MAESDIRRPVLLDTDIGTDVDDLLALALLVAGTGGAMQESDRNDRPASQPEIERHRPFGR